MLSLHCGCLPVGISSRGFVFASCVLLAMLRCRVFVANLIFILAGDFLVHEQRRLTAIFSQGFKHGSF